MSQLCLVMSMVTPVMGHSWKASVPMAVVATWPVMTTMGIESIMASASGVTMLVAPGPARHHGHAGPARDVGVALGHVPGPLLVAHQDVADRRVEDGVVDGQDGPAGEAEDDLHVLHLEALDEGLGPGQLHGRSLSLGSGWVTGLPGTADLLRPGANVPGNETTSRLGGRKAHGAAVAATCATGELREGRWSWGSPVMVRPVCTRRDPRQPPRGVRQPAIRALGIPEWAPVGCAQIG